MRTEPIVLSVSDSPVLQETLAILLEHDCRFRPLAPSEVDTAALSMSDLALVSGGNCNSAIDRLLVQRPTLSVLVIGADSAVGAPRRAARTVRDVPLDPAAIRAAVREHLPQSSSGTAPPETDSALRDMVATIVRTVQTDLHYPFTALRTFTSTRVTQGGGRVDPILSGVVNEQCAVLDECQHQLARFQVRARQVTLSPDFADVFCKAIQDAARASARGFRCEISPRGVRGAPGPAPLAALVAGLVVAHARRRAAAPLLRIEIQGGAITVRYAARLSVRRDTQSVALLLASLALQAFAWSVTGETDRGEDILRLTCEAALP